MKKNKLILKLQREIKKKRLSLIVGPMKYEGYFKSSLDTPVIFIDGGTKHLKNFKSHLYQLSIGDSDSSDTRLDIKASTKKDFSDLKLGLDIANNKVQRLYLDGFFPKLKNELRWDHRIANMGECFHWARENKAIVFLNSHSFILPKGIHSLEIWGEFSLFSLYELKLKIIGQCEYQIKRSERISPFSSRGLSNIGKGRIIIYSGEPVIIIKNLKDPTLTDSLT
jgi:thiamine pyrophosphokinase